MPPISPLALVALATFLALVYVFGLSRWVMAQPTGTPGMQKVSGAIRSGAEAFMRRMNWTIARYAFVLGLGLFVAYALFDPEGPVEPWKIGVSFLVGALCSGLAGYAGMAVSIRSNIRTASAARSSINSALKIALRGGAVSGLIVVAMSILGVTGILWLFGGTDPAQASQVPMQVVGFGFGASFVALFAQLGGGIYTKAADVGADLVGKVEIGIPEDDPRNPAVIADLVGDNVGDCAGRGADLFESVSAENIGAMILGVALFPVFGLVAILYPLLAGAIGLFASIAGVAAVHMRSEDEDPMKALNRGFFVTTLVAAVGLAVLTWVCFHKVPVAAFCLMGCVAIGLASSFLFVWLTQYYTEHRHRPVQMIARSTATGPATTIITGIAVGLECTFLPVISICGAILGAYFLGVQGLAGEHGNHVISAHAAGLFGIAAGTIGMLSTAGYILAMDTFGPITDNAGGIVEMAPDSLEEGQRAQDDGAGHALAASAVGPIRQRTDRLDAAGNTTKALTKGYAVGSAALAAFLLFSAYLDQVKFYVEQRGHQIAEAAIYTVDIGKPAVFVGAFVGAMLVFLFSSRAIFAVGAAAETVIEDVRAQLKEKPGIMDGTEDPDYGRCVDLVTKSALREMIIPGIMPVIFPLAVGLGIKYAFPANEVTIGAEAVAGLLMVATITGILLALLLNNAGGAWDNAKKFIELGNHGGKGSEAHKASVVGDTVGDPFKDTAGPSLHVLIKLLATVTLVLAPLFIR
jgi:K(+)-stimulated pyrophosphate-energized sodium pump